MQWGRLSLAMFHIYQDDYMGPYHDVQDYHSEDSAGHASKKVGKYLKYFYAYISFVPLPTFLNKVFGVGSVYFSKDTLKSLLKTF